MAPQYDLVYQDLRIGAFVINERHISDSLGPLRTNG